MSQNVISISRGPQFRGGKSAYLFIVLLFLILAFVLTLIFGGIIPALIMAPIIVLLVFLVLDIQGVDINKEKNLIRTYKVHPWGKVGTWNELQDFNRLTLERRTYSMKVSTFYTNLSTIQPNSHGIENHGHFLTLLVNKNGRESIILAENLQYKEAKKESVEISKKIGYPLEDTYNQSVADSRQRRRR
ncbi:MAG: hypothetical protein P8P74_08880 [Crocinitomicaceae bacterium]|nr:hypothetical protein [Crocinitomicaceae bacterium]